MSLAGMPGVKLGVGSLEGGYTKCVSALLNRFSLISFKVAH